MVIKLEDLKRIANYELPGALAHVKMSPKMRQSAAEIRSQTSDFKESAILIALYEKNGEIFFPLIERNVYDGTHSGQMSFPGGKLEEQDNNLMETALRETDEEIGLQLTSDDVIHELSEIYIPPSKFMVSPFVALCKGPVSFTPNEKEVAQIVEFPLFKLMDDETIEEVSVHVKKYNMNMKVPAFVYQAKVVWGATAIILSEFKEIILKLNVNN